MPLFYVFLNKFYLVLLRFTCGIHLMCCVTFVHLLEKVICILKYSFNKFISDQFGVAFKNIKINNLKYYNIQQVSKYLK